MELHSYNEHMALRVFEDLDPNDLLEANALRGETFNHLALFADWRGAAQQSVIALVFVSSVGHSATPFAVLNLMHTGQSGVAQGAFLARNHKRFRADLIDAGRRIRRQLPIEAGHLGINRIEARSWTGHPTASNFLKICGFRCEAQSMPGFGVDGLSFFSQFAWSNSERK